MAHLETPLSQAALARQLGISPRALQLQFRSQLNMTAQAYYLHLRLNEADRLVRESRQALQEIALATGFHSQASFSRAFRSQFQMSARQRRTLQAAAP